MKKYLCSVCALLLCAVILVGCGKGKSFDITEYLDTGWATTDISPQYYELYLATYMLEGYDGMDTFVDLTFRYYQNAGDYNVAEVFSTFDSAEFTSNAFTFDFFDDGWGHSGKITLTFNKDSIDVSISNLQGGFGGKWGLAEDRVTLYKNPDVTNDPISGGSEEFYDTSKASGILASIGMTEQEFKDSCQRLFSESVQIGSPDGTELYYVDLVEYPNTYIGQHFVIDNLAGYDFSCVYKGISDDGYPYYEDTTTSVNAVIYDFRDDVYSPNITKGNKITPYVTFQGVRTINGNEWLVFWMISCDKD